MIQFSDMCGLQYLSGYVVHKFLRKARNIAKYKCEVDQAIIGVLENFIEVEHISQRLIVTQSSGGLTAVKSEILKIFLTHTHTHTHTNTYRYTLIDTHAYSIHTYIKRLDY